MKMSKRLRPLALAALVLSGCGGGPEAPPPNEYIGHQEVRSLQRHLCQRVRQVDGLDDRLMLIAEKGGPDPGLFAYDHEGQRWGSRTSQVLPNSTTFRAAVSQIVDNIRKATGDQRAKSVYRSPINILSELGRVEARFAKELIRKYPDRYELVADEDDPKVRVQNPGPGKNVCSSYQGLIQMYFGSYIRERDQDFADE